MELDPSHAIRPLNGARWRERWHRLCEIGGPPGN
jgi:hypothetical protein